MFKPFVLIFSLVFSSLAGATTVTLTGDNSQPGFLNLVVGGTTVQALDYTGQRYASQGETWNANVYTFSQLSEAYYSPSDPYINLPNYLNVYEEDIYLFNLLADTPSPSSAVKSGIQNAIYYLSGASGFTSNSYVVQAQTDIATDGVNDLGNLSDYRFVDSPFTTNGHETPADNLQQGFMYTTACLSCSNQVPEPSSGSLLLIGMGLIGAGVVSRSYQTRS